MNERHRGIAVWLALVCATIVSLVVVGGITRLTHSGLSMVQWQPLLGVLPPRSPGAWQERFQQYRQYPEYRVLNRDMTLEEFKGIFFWEYLHRMLGRTVGLVFLLPYLYFLARRRFRPGLALKLAAAFVLGGLQGLLGWYMVRSGLAENPYVSHYRLAAHLGLALLLFGWLFWLLLDLVASARPPARPSASPYRKGALVLLLVLASQIIYGAFVAGLHAGFMFNTYPRMLGRWLPPGLLETRPWWVDLTSNPLTVQFVHRWLGMLFVAGAVLFWLRVRRSGRRGRQTGAALLLMSLALLQLLLGVLTLVRVVPIGLAALHQFVACLLLGAALFNLFIHSRASAFRA